LGDEDGQGTDPLARVVLVDAGKVHPDAEPLGINVGTKSEELVQRVEHAAVLRVVFVIGRRGGRMAHAGVQFRCRLALAAVADPAVGKEDEIVHCVLILQQLFPFFSFLSVPARLSVLLHIRNGACLFLAGLGQLEGVHNTVARTGKPPESLEVGVADELERIKESPLFLVCCKGLGIDPPELPQHELWVLVPKHAPQLVLQHVPVCPSQIGLVGDCSHDGVAVIALHLQLLP